MRKFTLVLASLVFCGVAQAASPHEQSVSAYFGSTDLKSGDDEGSATITGRELGARVAFNIASGVFGRVEYSGFDGSKTIDGVRVNATIDEFRIGPGYALKISDLASVYAEANYTVISLDATATLNNVEATSSAETNGFVIAVGGSLTPIPALSIYGRAGYVSVEDKETDEKANGPDLLAGVDYGVTESFGVFAEYRYSTLEFDDGDTDLNTYRGGVRVRF